MTLRPTIAAILSGSLLLAGLALMVPAAMASDGHSTEIIRIEDRCDPNNFPGIPCAPHKDDNIGLAKLVNFVAAHPRDVLKERNALGWRFHPDDTTAKLGATLVAVDFGGEAHTFSNVTATGFTLGCVPEVNALFPKGILPDSNLCADPGPNGFLRTLVTPGGSLSVPVNTSGTSLFQCLIHPWMRLSVDVRNH